VLYERCEPFDRKTLRQLVGSVPILVALSRSLLDDAATLPPLRLPSVDAIHLAAAQRAGTSLRAVVTYDGSID
jgi:predicted nucleic acid-binding protein